MGTGTRDHIQRRRPFPPERRAHALHAPALLVNRDDRITPNSLAHLTAERIGLIRRVDVARKEDEAKGVRIAKKRLFLFAQPQPVRINDRGPVGHQRVTTGMQSALAATRAEQN